MLEQFFCQQLLIRGLAMFVLTIILLKIAPRHCEEKRSHLQAVHPCSSKDSNNPLSPTPAAVTAALGHAQGTETSSQAAVNRTSSGTFPLLLYRLVSALILFLLKINYEELGVEIITKTSL